MDKLGIAENLIRLRRSKSVTQEDLANFLGITKASVSKWENSQSMPDILLLPRIASYFDITVDALLGYEPQLSREQIQRLYHDLAADFAKRPFEEVMERCTELVKKYYSCYPFLFQMCILWMNHCDLIKDNRGKRELYENILGLCSRIMENSRDVGLCQDTLFTKAFIYLQLGKAKECIELIEEPLNPVRMVRQSAGLLIQAYMTTGKKEKAERFAQMNLFLYLLLIVDGASQYLSLHAGETEVCMETIRRVESLMENWHLDRLHRNSAAIFQYQSAAVFCISGDEEEALRRLECYADLVLKLVQENCIINRDTYFSLIEEWTERLDLGSQLIRDKKMILESALGSLENPVFAPICHREKFKRIQDRLRRG